MMTELKQTIRNIVDETRIVDIHTHLFDPSMGSILLWGIDELLTYHYLIAEVFRVRPDLSYEVFWNMPKPRQADMIWTELFRKRSPISEACRGVLTVLQAFGLDANTDHLHEIRDYFRQQNSHDHVDKVFALAHVKKVYMTNDPLDPEEGRQWIDGFERDPRFLGVLRLDSALMHWPAGAGQLARLGYHVDDAIAHRTRGELTRYLHDWCERLHAKYMAISLPPTFTYPDTQSSLVQLLTETVFPIARERNIPVAMMIGVKKLVNQKLALAGDAVGKFSINTLERIAADHPDNRFLVTILSRENQHELCVVARKFANILPFGCWWFLNNPSIVREMTTMRLETLGLSFVPQHSDARVLEQLVYKWQHSRAIIAEVLTEKYQLIQNTGLSISEANIRRDMEILLGETWMP